MRRQGDNYTGSFDRSYSNEEPRMRSTAPKHSLGQNFQFGAHFNHPNAQPNDAAYSHIDHRNRNPPHPEFRNYPAVVPQQSQRSLYAEGYSRFPSNEAPNAGGQSFAESDVPRRAFASLQQQHLPSSHPGFNRAYRSDSTLQAGYRVTTRQKPWEVERSRELHEFGEEEDLLGFHQTQEEPYTASHVCRRQLSDGVHRASVPHRGNTIDHESNARASRRIDQAAYQPGDSYEQDRDVGRRESMPELYNTETNSNTPHLDPQFEVELTNKPQTNSTTHPEGMRYRNLDPTTSWKNSFVENPRVLLNRNESEIASINEDDGCMERVSEPKDTPTASTTNLMTQKEASQDPGGGGGDDNYDRESPDEKRRCTQPLTDAIEEIRMIGDHSSYHEALTGRQAKKRLQLFCSYKKDCNRCYLTRFSSGNNAYVLSVYRKEQDGETMIHFEIVIDHREQYNVKGKLKKFLNIDELLQWYEKNQFDARMTTIGQSCSKQDYNLAVEAEENKRHQEELLRRQQEDFRRQQEELRKRQREEEEIRQQQELLRRRQRAENEFRRREEEEGRLEEQRGENDTEDTDSSNDSNEPYDDHRGQRHYGVEHDEVERDETGQGRDRANQDRAGHHGGDGDGAEPHQQHRNLQQRETWFQKHCTIS